MRRVWRLLAVVFGLSLVVPVATPGAFAASDGAATRQRLEASVGTQPDATVALEPFTETERSRKWAIAVTGGTASVDAIDVDDSGSSFDVTVVGDSATVEMTLTVSAGTVLRASCFDFDNQVEIGHVVSTRRLVLEVVPAGLYDCRYETERKGRSPVPVGSVPPTDTALARPERSASWVFVLAMITGLIAGAMLLRRRSTRSSRS